ncbi:MAG: transposase [Atopobiaceae bacterium]|nr:transposase [Atopobium sp.]MCH4082561.1 transposase [Atopobiaceae bacterium]MCI1497738.1 transposase [Atopobiaceae bacterium]MCI1539214.1 transposase [Atopobiaceae bacterium]
MERSYEMRIYPNARQRELIGRTFGCCRWVYNKCLEERRAAYESTGKSPTRFQQDRMLPSWKAENPWLMEADSHALQQAVADLDRAYQNFFRRCRQGGRPGYPRFRSKRDARQSYRTSQGVSVPDARHVKLPKLGLVKARVSRGIEGRVLSATVKQVPSGRYFVCLCCTDCPEPEAAPGAIAVLGIDAGVHDLMVRSDGVKIASPRALARSERRLAREQRRLSRKRKGSASTRKQKRKVARIHERIADQRKDAIHKATTDAVRESQAIAVEDLDVRGMERDRRLAKAVADASMSEMLRQLEYKCSWHGRRFVKVSRWYPSSKTCSCCGHVLEELPLSVRAWTCPACGARHDRDFNAALNIAREGARLLDRADGTAGPAGTSGAKASGTLLEQA